MVCSHLLEKFPSCWALISLGCWALKMSIFYYTFFLYSKVHWDTHFVCQILSTYGPVWPFRNSWCLPSGSWLSPASESPKPACLFHLLPAGLPSYYNNDFVFCFSACVHEHQLPSTHFKCHPLHWVYFFTSFSIISLCYWHLFSTNPDMILRLLSIQRKKPTCSFRKMYSCFLFIP